MEEAVNKAEMVSKVETDNKEATDRKVERVNTARGVNRVKADEDGEGVASTEVVEVQANRDAHPADHHQAHRQGITKERGSDVEQPVWK